MASKTTGILLINLGTPEGYNVPAVRRYLREFLHDPRVIDLPYLVRKILVDLVILPFRPRQSAKAYRQVWTDQGSPLLVYSQRLIEQLSAELPSDLKLALGMRYGKPSIEHALSQLQSCSNLIVLPLFPQYSSAATGSAIEKTLDCLKSWQNLPNLTVIRDFHDHSAFIASQAAIIKAHLPQTFDTLLLSFHGLPERHLLKGGCESICAPICPNQNKNPASCYRKQCYITSRLLQAELALSDEKIVTSFQSRLGKTPWIQPYTDELLDKLYQQGCRKLVIACPSFTADCLETIEEIGMQAREQWQQLGGTDFTLVPCLNDNSQWISALAGWLGSLIGDDSTLK